MNIFKKNIFLSIAVFLFFTAPVFSQSDVGVLYNSTESFSKEMAGASLLNSSIGLNWSDAYIGQFMPRFHFGVGLTVGYTTIDYESINNLMKGFNLSLPLDDKFEFFKDVGYFIPNYVVDARIGGFGIPFDFGVKFGFIPKQFISLFSSDDKAPGIQTILIGADIRFALVVRKAFPFRFSAGIGFNYLDGRISTVLPEFKLEHNAASLLDLKDPKVDILWRSINTELKLQASFPYKFFTPYLGFAGGFAWSQAGYVITTDITDSEVSKLNGNYGFTKVTGSGVETLIQNYGFNVRPFAGFSVNFIYFRLDIAGTYEILGNNFGSTVGMRFQR